MNCQFCMHKNVCESAKRDMIKKVSDAAHIKYLQDVCPLDMMVNKYLAELGYSMRHDEQDEQDEMNDR